jgi:hypothetical protein
MGKIYRDIFEILKGAAIICCFTAVLAFTHKVSEDADSYYVYSDKWEHGIPTGFMGEKDGKSLKMDDGWKDNPYKGEKCIKMAIDNSEGWRGLHIQFTGGWNVAVEPTTVLPDLSQYEKFEFYARAETKDGSSFVISEIGVGGGGGFEDHRSDTYVEIGPQWQKYTINLKGMDLKRLNTMMMMVLPVGTLYMDEIRFIKKKKKE